MMGKVELTSTSLPNSLPCSSVLSSLLGPGVPQDGSDDEDEEWPTLEKAATMTGAGHHTEVVVDPEDERAIEMFMNKNPPAR